MFLVPIEGSWRGDRPNCVWSRVPLRAAFLFACPLFVNILSDKDCCLMTDRLYSLISPPSPLVPFLLTPLHRHLLRPPRQETAPFGSHLSLREEHQQGSRI